jgi:hypothetical protein
VSSRPPSPLVIFRNGLLRYPSSQLELDDLLDDGGYVPSFSRAPTTANNKSLAKNSSTKSIETGIHNPAPPARTSMLQLHKDTRREVTTFEDFFKDQNAVPPKPLDRK